jgi:aspartyl-tRNA(Asn)/glutamyl-tRNA(Gln) amidotransferase subunit C
LFVSCCVVNTPDYRPNTNQKQKNGQQKQTRNQGSHHSEPLQHMLNHSKNYSYYAYFAHLNTLTSPTMKITQDEAQHVATLAKLRLTPQELETYTSQLNHVLQAFQKLAEVKTAEAQSSPALLTELPLREDLIAPSMSHHAVLQNAPAKEQGGFSVPKIVEK